MRIGMVKSEQGEDPSLFFFQNTKTKVLRTKTKIEFSTSRRTSYCKIELKRRARLEFRPQVRGYLCSHGAQGKFCLKEAALFFPCRVAWARSWIVYNLENLEI